MKASSFFQLIWITSFFIILFTGSCNTKDDPEPVINWIDLAHYSSIVTNVVPLSDTPEGFRVDLYFEGPISGDSIIGFMSGIDYYFDRADGIGEINAYATIVTNDDALITVHITGYVYEDGSIQDEIVKFESGNKKYSWLNNTLLTGNGNMTSDTSFVVDYYYSE